MASEHYEDSPHKNILIIDGYNMIHRCRFQWGGGTAMGEYSIVYNFFRTLRSLLGEFNPDIVYFPLDGKPAKRLESFAAYKANRKVLTQDPAQVAYWDSFRRQKRVIIDALQKDYPIRTAYHPNHECDDIVPYLINKYHPNDNTVVASSDTDFIQLLNTNPDNVRLYNPITKSYRQNTNYDYVSWKAMVGDKSDNIPGVRGIGKKTATKILEKEGELSKRLEDRTFKDSYELSYGLIKFLDLTEDENDIIYTKADLDEESIAQEFESMDFKTMLEEKFLEKYFNTFNTLR